MKYLSYLIFLFTPLFAREVAITFDDHPIPATSFLSIEQRTEKLMEACSAHQIKAVFYCIGAYCKNPAGFLSLISLNDEGHFLANHSMTHRHLSQISLTEFEAEILETDYVLSPFSQMRKWYRYPYLDYGNRAELGGSQEKAIAAYELLHNLGYLEGYVTINTFDWHINARLQKAIQEEKKINYDTLRTLYLYLLEDWCSHYDQLFQKLVPTKIIHTLLLHANDLNALFLHDILNRLSNLGWTIVSPERAMQSLSWRLNLFKKPLPITKPFTLDLSIIDSLLDYFQVFTHPS